jgi:hypothetical protein
MNVDFKPATVVCDFEQAFINAASEQVILFDFAEITLFDFLCQLFQQLPDTLVTGCWFHFCQSCYRNTQKLGLMALYDDHAETRELLRSFMALALLPIDRIDEGFQLLKHKILAADHKDQLQLFVSYFEKEWMQNCPPSTWSVGGKRWRTNNHAEGESLIFYSFAMKLLTNLHCLLLSFLAQNRRFSSRVVQPHPNLWRFIQCLKQEESVISHRMIQTGLGCSSVKESKSTRKAAQKTKQIDKLLKLLESKERSLPDTIASLTHLVGEPVGRGKRAKKKKHNVTKSDVSDTS